MGGTCVARQQARVSVARLDNDDFMHICVSEFCEDFMLGISGLVDVVVMRIIRGLMNEWVFCSIRFRWHFSIPCLILYFAYRALDHFNILHACNQLTRFIYLHISIEGDL